MASSACSTALAALNNGQLAACTQDETCLAILANDAKLVARGAAVGVKQLRIAAKSLATRRALPDGYRVLDDSVGAARPTLPDGHIWVADADGNAIIPKPDGTFATSRTDIDNIVTAPNRAVPDGYSFGRYANQEYHTWRHVIDEMGMNRQSVQNAIIDDLPPASDLSSGLNVRFVTVDGTRLQYNTFKFPDGTVNIGRIHEAN